MSQLCAIAPPCRRRRSAAPRSSSSSSACCQALNPILSQLRPTDAQVGSVLHYGGATSAAVPVSAVTDVQPLSASFNTTWEVGYKGIIAQRLRIALDLWYQIRGDVGVADRPDQSRPCSWIPTKLQSYLGTAIIQGLMAGGYSLAQAQGVVAQALPALIPIMAGLPQGTLAFTNTKLAPDQSIIASYTNGVGEIDVRGADFALDYQLNDTLDARGTRTRTSDRTSFRRSAASPMR